VTVPRGPDPIRRVLTAASAIAPELDVKSKAAANFVHKVLQDKPKSFIPIAQCFVLPSCQALTGGSCKQLA
jgi:hypothetical protein